jgi:hypothetical protein
MRVTGWASKAVLAAGIGGVGRRGLLALFAVSLGLGLVSCGGDGSPTVTPAPTPVPTPPPPTVVLQESWQLDANFVDGFYFDIGSTGTIDATVDYTHDDTLLVVYVATGTCTFNMFIADQCEFVATSLDGPRPRTVSATNQRAGTYTIIVWNVGPHSESGVIQVVFAAQAAATTQPATRQRHHDGVRVWGPTRRPAGK